MNAKMDVVFAWCHVFVMQQVLRNYRASNFNADTAESPLRP